MKRLQFRCRGGNQENGNERWPHHPLWGRGSQGERKGKTQPAATGLVNTKKRVHEYRGEKQNEVAIKEETVQTCDSTGKR